MFGPEEIWLVAGGFVALCIGLVLYMIGGTDMGPGMGGQKWIRRFLGSFIIVGATNIVALLKGVWNYPLIFMWGALIGGFSLPYGSDTLWGKITKRIVFALGCIATSFFGYWAMGFPAFGLGIIIFQTIVGLTSVYLGVKNPYSNAPLEQGMICLLLTLTTPFWAYVR